MNMNKEAYKLMTYLDALMLIFIIAALLWHITGITFFAVVAICFLISAICDDLNI
jgi:hypothetical protein